MPPFNGGGEMIREVCPDRAAYREPPHRFLPGTPKILQAIGLGSAIDYVSPISKERIMAQESALVEYEHERLREIISIPVTGRRQERAAIVFFAIKGALSDNFATIIDGSGVAARAGAHCAVRLLEECQVPATCCAPYRLYNTFDEVDCLAQAGIKAQTLFRE
jgi:cysteine desulfurase/selenocysteine lyase